MSLVKSMTWWCAPCLEKGELVARPHECGTFQRCPNCGEEYKFVHSNVLYGYDRIKSLDPYGAAAKEADRWASGLCSAHVRADPMCPQCNTRLLFGPLVTEHRNAAWNRALTAVLKGLEELPKPGAIFTFWAEEVKSFILKLPKEEPR